MAENDIEISAGGASKADFSQELLDRIGLTAQQLLDMGVTPDELIPVPIEERWAADGADFLKPLTQKETDELIERCAQEQIWGLSPEGVRELLTAPVRISGFEEYDNDPKKIIVALERGELP